MDAVKNKEQLNTRATRPIKGHVKDNLTKAQREKIKYVN